MPTFDARFLDSTRGQVLSLLRRGSRTIDELARVLGVSDNAVRAHISALERDGLVRRRGSRPTGGKPAYAYEVEPEAERLFTRAYVPVLTHLVGVLEERLGTAELEAILREVGARLAAAGGTPGGDFRSRAAAAAVVLTELGGLVDVEEHEGRLTLSGHGCPLADAVRAHPGTCRAAESLVAELVGRPVQEHCERGERPRCRFDLGEAPPER